MTEMHVALIMQTVIILGFAAGAIVLQILSPCLWLEIVLLVFTAATTIDRRK